MDSDNIEIISNLWYVMNPQGFIYSLRARLYIAGGDDEQKLAFLHQFAMTDYMIARSFPLPNGFKTSIVHPGGEDSFPIIHINDVDILGGPGRLFSEAFDVLEGEVPDETPYTIPEDPLMVVTPLHTTPEGYLIPIVTKREKI